MIAISPRSVGSHWETLSFASTLYLCPILDLLLEQVPNAWYAELRLGLQEALVNAAKHGNQLDPSKLILVRFLVTDSRCWWIISNEGTGFAPPSAKFTEQCSELNHYLPTDDRECGRGLYILHQIFDQVQWNSKGTELSLYKQVKSNFRLPFIH